MNELGKQIERKHTGCLKYDALKQFFGKDGLIPLWVADMDFAVCPAITEALTQRISHPVYGYAVTPDSFWSSITDWLQRRHSFAVTQDEITFVPGVVRGLSAAIRALSDPSDKVVIQSPVYHPFRMTIEANRRVVLNNPLVYTAEGFRMDLDSLECLVEREKPRMMILCNPHNPGGMVWQKDDLRRVADICKRNNVVVLSDEIHGDLELFGNRYTPFAAVSEAAAEVSVMFGAPSKTFNIAGIVSSWCVVKNPSLRRRLFASFCVSGINEPTFVQTTATEAAYRSGEAWLDKIIGKIESNVVYTEEFFRKRLPQVKVMRPQASFLVWLDCTALRLDHDALVRLFVDEAGLALNDGEIFGRGGEGHMRLNVGCCKDLLNEAFMRLEKAVNQLNI